MFKQSVAAIVIGLACLAVAPAFADIKAYNDAVRAGDYKTAAAEAKGVWTTFDKSSPDAAAVAREFGFSSYLAGDYAAAHDYGQFLKDKGPTLPTPDDQPVVSAVLLAAADYRLDPKSARDELSDALVARAMMPGRDNISVLAAEALYNGDWNSAAWSKSIKSADLAAGLIERAGPALRPRFYRARISGAAAEFLASPTPRDWQLMADIHDAIIDDINATADPAARDALARQLYSATTWLTALHTFVHSNAHQTGSHISVEVKERKLKELTAPLFPDVADPRPVCKGRATLGNFNYPSAAEFRGLPGAVLLKLDFDDAGKVSHAEVLGSVPSDIFANALVKASPGFRWVPDERQNLKACRLRRNNYMLSVEFLIG
ncbi:MAG: hypothetical protein ABI740_10550 [Alphaproteobacteria bacterium]